VLAVLVLLLAACQPIQPLNHQEMGLASANLMEQQNIAVVQKFYDEFANGNAEVILEVHPETINMHYAGEVETVPTQVLY
jgi:hypothetical protein